MKRFIHFLHEDSGAITTDWVALTAGVLVVGLIAVYSIYGNGVTALVVETNDRAIASLADVDPGTVRNMNQ